jgi:hypothetical protein
MVQECSRRSQFGGTNLCGETHREIAQAIKYENCTIPFRLIFLLILSTRKADGDDRVDHYI